MYFQIAVSPADPAKKQQSVVPLEDVAVLKLAPFAPNPKIFFENVAVGEMETKKLIIQNPSAFNVQLRITKLLPADRYVTLSWNEVEIEAHEETTLELTWAPKEEGGWREVLSILDNKNVTRNVPIIFKSHQKKGKRRTVAKQTARSKPTVVAVPAVKKFRSPKNAKKKCSPLKVSDPVCVPKAYKCENCHNNIHITTCSPLKKKRNVLESNKENSPIMFQQKLDNLSPVNNLSFSKLSFSEKLNRMDNSSFFSSPTNVNFKCDNILQTPIRRETYAIHRQPIINNIINSPDHFNDSLEIEKKIDSLQVTPKITATPVFSNKNNSSDDYLVQKLLSDSFAFSTATITKKTSQYKLVLNDTEILDEIFNPNNCSTETKQPLSANGNNSSTPKELFKPNSTYELSPGGKNCSPHNLSGGTYTMSNVSSSSTYALLSPDDIHSRIRELTDSEKSANYAKISTSSPVLPHAATNQFHATSNYLNFSGINAKAALSCITEEEQFSDISIRNASIRSDISNAGMKRKSEQPLQPETIFTVSPPKRAFIKPRSPKPLKTMNTSWSKKLDKTEKIRRKSISTLKLNLSKSCSKSNISDISSSSSISITQTSCNIDPFLIAAMYNSNTSTVNSNLDPFISSTLYYDETWLDKQMKELKKWLNALLTPPSELAAKAESKKVDVAKLWQDCVKKELIYAPTKEKVSSKYHTNHKLEILRKSAKNLFHSLDMRNVLSKVTVTIENKQMSIREDKNLHLDVGLQSHILTLLLCYNPLWLRIGLETIYNESIPLESNSDVIGLSTFIMLRFFRCPNLMPKNKQGTHIKYLPAYATAVKKFTLKKFLMLIYFLDQAKTKKLISHDPCLFCRDAPVKESKELLLFFARELLSAVGDITKFLRRLGYEVYHKQSYIDEFDYAVKNLGVDLRDGIRLTKVMEIILIRNDLTNQLRGPAISRLQKIHNVKLALDSLLQAGYAIAGDITSKDIVDGHREKTLSLLWQIIYKFQAPRFTKAASKIQIWWRSLTIVIKRRMLDRPRQLKINAAIKIQQFYRSWKLMQKERGRYLVIKKSIITIQRFIRSVFLMKHDRLMYLLKKQSVIIIQQNYRAIKLMKIQRSQYLTMKKSAILIQQQFRALFAMKKAQEHYLKLKEIIIKMQRIFRSKQIVKEHRNNYLQKRSAAIVIQSHFKATQQMKIDRNIYLHTKNVVIKIQQRFRATILMKEVRSTYLEQRKSIIFLQQKYRAHILMKETRKYYLKQRQAVVTIQQRFRANLAMKQSRENYLAQRKSVIVIQENFRAYLAMKNSRENYLKLKQATMFIQRKFKANLAMKNARKNYLQQKYAAVFIQQKCRAYLEMKICRENYLMQKQAVVTIQNHFRGYIAMKNCRENYLKLQQSTLFIQHKFRANKAMKTARKNYLQERFAAIIIQQKFKAYLKTKMCRENYLMQRQAAVTIQNHFRAYLAMKNCRQNYLKLQQSTLFIQHKFKANMAMKTARKNYLRQRFAAIIIQQKFKAYLKTKICRENYLMQRQAVVTIQNYFRGYLAMKNCRQNYLKLQQSTLFIQHKFRANKAMKIARKNYLQQRYAAIVIQQKLKAYFEMKICRENYLKLKQVTVFIQQRFRANLAMKNARENYLNQRESAICLQQTFRAYLQMKKCRKNYLELKSVATYVQQTYRANIAMKEARNNYLELKKSTVMIQQRFKANIHMRETREIYLKNRKAVIYVQQKYRAKLAMKNENNNYLLLKKAAINTQRRFRAKLLMKKQQQLYLKLKESTITIQRIFRANIAMKIAQENYLKQRQIIIKMQQIFRATQSMKITRDNYLRDRNIIIKLQQRIRANSAMKTQNKYYISLKNAAVNIQRRYRANKLMKIQQYNYLQQKQAVAVIQEHFRAYLDMKKCRNNYLELIKSVIIIQTTFRAKLEMDKCRENYIQLRKAVILIQNKFRAKSSMKKAQENYVQYRKTVIKVQQRFRANISMKKDRQIYLEKRRSITLLQQKYRAIVAMRKDRKDYLKTRNAVITLQQHFRANVAMKTDQEKYLQIRKTVLFLQERFRANVSMKKVRNDYLQIKRSVIVIQQRFRAYLAMKAVRQHYILQRKVSLTIQRRFRANLAMKQTRQRFVEQKLAVVKIQRWFRNVTITKKYEQHYLLQKKSVCIIQQRFREYILMKKQRTVFLEMKKSVLFIQNHFRSYLLTKKYRTDFLYTVRSVTTIQTYYRSYLMMRKCRKEFLMKKQAAIKIQRYYRAFLKKSSAEKLQLKIKAVVKIQCWVRMHAAKKQLAILRQNSKEIEERKIQRKLNKAAGKIQAVWRGYKTRKAMSKKMALIHQRSLDATNNAVPESTVGQRNKDAIYLLMYQTSMKEIIRALTILDFTTRLFPNLCIEVCNDITERLYILLVCTNRSVPDMDASVLCVSVLINLYKYPPTSDAVWKIQYVERLLSLLLHWSDKDSVLFPYVCTLVWLFAQKSEYCEVILAEKNAEKILVKTYQQCERRQKMLTRMRNVPHVKKQKDVLPSLVPDWGIINLNRPRVFKNPEFAVKCLLKKLNIPINN